LLLAVVVILAEAKKPSRPRSVGSAGSRRSSTSSRDSSRSGRPSVSKRKPVIEDDEVDFDDDLELDVDMDDPFDEEDDEEEEDEDTLPFDDDEEEEEDDLPPPPRRSKNSSRRAPPSSRSSREAALYASNPKKRKAPPRRRYEDEEDDEDYYAPPRSSRSGRSSSSSRRPPSSRRGPPPRRGSVVPYSRQQGPGAFVKGIEALRSSIPDTTALREAAAASIKSARETSSSLSSNFYRDIKGLTSSELEQVMLKATKPDDTPAKGKHVERLVGVTYQINSRYDIYDAVLRKLWGKMTENDWRTTMKALYILHRFSADGAPEHAPALKARLRELRRTQDPKRKDKFFNSKQLLAGEAKPDNIKFRAFMSRYAHYVLLRAQCFSGMFEEISTEPKVDKKKPPKPITSTSLRTEHLEAALMLLKAGLACQLKDGEECENTAIAVERVASDLIGLTSAVAIALNRALKDVALKGGDPALIKKWCEVYSEQLLPQTKAMVKKTSSKLDAYGLFLPSRMGTSVSREVLNKGLNLDTEAALESISEEEVVPEGDGAAKSTKKKEATTEKEPEVEAAEAEDDAEEDEEEEDDDEEEEAEDEDEYEYEEEEYYDDEEE
jgi:hypothetical protein